MSVPKKNKDPEIIRMQVAFLRTCNLKLEGEHERNLTTAVTEAKRKFSRFAPLIDKLDKICRQENNAALGIVLAGELNYGMESEAAMEECLDNAKTIIDDWITLSNLAKGNSQD